MARSRAKSTGTPPPPPGSDRLRSPICRARGLPVLSGAVPVFAGPGRQGRRGGGLLLPPFPHGLCVGGQKEGVGGEKRRRRSLWRCTRQLQWRWNERVSWWSRRARGGRGRRGRRGGCRNPFPCVLHARPLTLRMLVVDTGNSMFQAGFPVAVLPTLCSLRLSAGLIFQTSQSSWFI